MQIRTVESEVGVVIYAEEGQYKGQVVGTADTVSLHTWECVGEKEYKGQLIFAWGLVTAEGVDAEEFVKYPLIVERQRPPLMIGRVT